ncbi:unnamed protein product [Mucor hiemalis]
MLFSVQHTQERLSSTRALFSIKEKANVAQNKLLQLANKRRKTHSDLHLETDRALTSLLVRDPASSTPLTFNKSSNIDHVTSEQIDDFFQSGPNFSMIELKRQIEQWQESAERGDQLHKQDLLFYNILDFVSSRPDTAAKLILRDKYSAFVEHLKSFYIPSEDIKEEVDALLKVDEYYVLKLCKNVVKDLNITDNKDGDICIVIYRFVNKQFRGNRNVFIDPSIKKYHFASAFIFPLLDETFDDTSRMVIGQKWRKTKLLYAKKNEHDALSDAHRRTPGPTIDGVYTIPSINHTEFVIIELSGGPSCDEFDHLGDRNKIAKNLKLMMKRIITQRVHKSCIGISSVKIYGLQVYKNDMFVYSIACPMVNRYTFSLELKFSLPTAPRLLQNMWKLKHMIVSSCKSVELFILEEVGDSENDVASNVSSPYVSPSKRKENKQ